MESVAKYVYKVYQEKSFSAAAKALYISQPALSAAISRLEKELDIRIFDRSKLPIALTPQGQIYIDALEEIMESENNMLRKLKTLSDTDYGTLSVGGGSYTSYHILPRICGRFYKKYPNVKVTVDAVSSDIRTHSEKLSDGDLDLFMSYVHDYPDTYAVPLFKERLIIAMHRDMKGAERLTDYALTKDEILSQNYRKEREIEDMSLFSEIPFFAFSKKSPTTIKLLEMLGDFKPAPYLIENASHSVMHHNMMLEGLGAFIIPESRINDCHNEILFFIPKHKDTYRTVYLVGRKGEEKNPLAENFINTAKEIFS